MQCTLQWQLWGGAPLHPRATPASAATSRHDNSPKEVNTNECKCSAHSNDSCARYHWERGDQLPFVSTTPRGSSTPECQGTSSGAPGCRARCAALTLPRMLTSGAAGASVNCGRRAGAWLRRSDSWSPNQAE